MELADAIRQRCSVRKYKKKEVKITDVLEILNIAKEAPSSGNLQNWRFIVVDDEKKRKDISMACLNQAWMIEAPVHIVICNDYGDVVESYDDAGKKYAMQNCAIVAQNIMLTSVKFRMGTCYVGAFDDFEMRKILKIPDSIDVEAVITLGYADEEEREKKYDLDILTYINEYGSRQIEKGSPLKDLVKKLKKA